MEKTVAVVGASGYLGLKIVRALLDQGAGVRAIVRATTDRTSSRPSASPISRSET